MSERTLAKAARLYDTGRVQLMPTMDGGADYAVVVGDSGQRHRVYAEPAGLRCTCPARGECSHSLAAALAWAGAPINEGDES